MWAFGIYNLNLTEEQLLDLSLKEYKALSERYQSDQDWLNYRGALICAVIVNMHRDPKKSKAVKPQDFMPTKPKQKAQTIAQMEATLKMLNSAYGGNYIVRES